MSRRVYRVTGYNWRYVLKKPIQQNAVETTIMPMDAVPVVLVERVHDRPRLQYQQRDTSGYPPSLTMASPLISRDRPRPPRHARAQGISRAKPLASWRFRCDPFEPRF